MCRKKLAIATACLLIASGSGIASAQLPSVVQLPSFQTFGYTGSVMVPDGGSTHLGGIRRSATFSSRAPGRRAFSSVQGNSQASVRATIIDLQEMDRQILGASPKEFVRAGKPVRAQKADPVEEGKALVRYARKQYREGKKSESFVTYQMAIGVLDGRLKQLAEVEFKRVFGASAAQSLRMAQTLR